MKKLLLPLFAGIMFISVTPVSHARTQESPKAQSELKQAQTPSQVARTEGFTGDGVEWWVVEQIIQRIHEIVSGHRT